MFRLTYKRHGGSGTNLTKSEVFELDWGMMVWWLERLDAELSEEARQIHNASAPKSRR